MKTYAYKGFDAAGSVRRGLVEALHVKEAREKLAASGVLAEHVTVIHQRLNVRAELRAMVYRELSALLNAGIPMTRALEMMMQSARAGSTGGVLAGVRDRVREGASLAVALTGEGTSATEFEQAAIQAGERAGTLTDVLMRLAVYLEDQDQVRERVSRALIYPALVVGVGICVALVMLGVLVPRAGALLADSGRPLPGLTRVVLMAGHAAARWGVWALLAAGVGGVYLQRRYRGDATLQRRWNQAQFRWPIWGRGYALLASLRFARTLAMLLRGGVPLVEGLRLSGRATGSAWVAHLASQEAEAVRDGERLSTAVRRIPPLVEALAEWVQVGEESGDLAGILDHAATRSNEHWNRYINRSLALLEPLLLLVIGAFVLLITLAVLLPVLALTQSLSAG